MEEEFRAILTGASAVTALVPAARINWGEHPQGAGLPGIVLNVISRAEGLTYKGPDGLFRSRVQVDCYALTYGQAKLLFRAVHTLLHGYVGAGFLLVKCVDDDDGREGGSNEAERPYRVRLDFETHWRST